MIWQCWFFLINCSLISNYFTLSCPTWYINLGWYLICMHISLQFSFELPLIFSCYHTKKMEKMFVCYQMGIFLIRWGKSSDIILYVNHFINIFLCHNCQMFSFHPTKNLNTKCVYHTLFPEDEKENTLKSVSCTLSFFRICR